MRKRITYGQSLVLCSQPPAYQDNANNVSGLKRVQSCGVSFTFARQRFKQIGSENFVGDVHLKNADVNFDMNYYYSNGTNEALFGLNVDGTSGHALKYVKRQRQDRNFYVLQGSGANEEPLLDSSYLDDYDVMAIGNSFLDQYSISAQVGTPISVAADFSAYNFQLDNYTTSSGEYIPAIDESQGIRTEEYRYKIQTGNVYNTTNEDGRIDAAFSPTHIEMVMPSDFNVAGLELTGQNVASLQSFDLGFSIERLDLYGFGSMYPYGRRALLPVVGSLNFSAFAREFETGTLHTIINSGEKEFDFTFNFLNCSGQTGLQLEVENAKVDNESFTETIGSNAQFDIGFSFPMSNNTGFRMSTPPLILNQPDQGDTTLTIEATGKSPITYEWFDASGPTSEATGPSFSPTGDGNYYCVASNDLGSGVSRVIYVDVP